MAIYTVIENTMGNVIQRDNQNGTFTYIPTDLANSDYQKYLKYLEDNK